MKIAIATVSAQRKDPFTGETVLSHECARHEYYVEGGSWWLYLYDGDGDHNYCTGCGGRLLPACDACGKKAGEPSGEYQAHCGALCGRGL